MRVLAQRVGGAPGVVEGEGDLIPAGEGAGVVGTQEAAMLGGNSMVDLMRLFPVTEPASSQPYVMGMGGIELRAGSGWLCLLLRGSGTYSVRTMKVVRLRHQKRETAFSQPSPRCSSTTHRSSGCCGPISRR